MKIPKKYTDMVGKEHLFSGGIFTPKKSLPETKFEVLDIRFSDAYIMDMKTHKKKHPAFELLLKNDTMKRSQWSRPFPIREIKLKS